MGKNPAFQFYPGDARRDVELHMMSFEARGIWWEMLWCMWDAKEKGKLEGTIPHLCRLIGCTAVELSNAVNELSVTKTADVTMRNEFITVINRRMFKEERERKLTRCRVAKHRVTTKKRNGNADVTPPSSILLSSSSSSKKKKIYMSPSGDNGSFGLFWKAYPRKAGKGYAEKAWKWLNPNKELLEKILTSIEKHKQSDKWKEDNGKFIPYPQKYLNGKCWEDELDIPLKTGAAFSTKQVDARSCYMRCHGNCAALWTKYKENTDHQCHWCTKFDAQRGEMNAL